MKKYSWMIAALLVALISIFFIGCGADPLPAPIDDSETFEDVDLGVKFNYVNAATQQGWATDGHNEATEKLGLTLEQFQTAKYLVIEFAEEGAVRGGMQLIWGAYTKGMSNTDLQNALGIDNAGWMSRAIVSDGGQFNGAYGTMTGKVMKLELSKALNRYDAFKSSEIQELKILLAYYSNNIADLGIAKAYLQISSVAPEFIEAESIVITPVANAVAKGDIKLAATITPVGTDVQTITWKIVGATDLVLGVDVNFKPIYKVDDSFDPPYTDTSVITGRAKDTLWVTKSTGGKVKVQAILKEAALDADGKKIDVKSSVYEIDVGLNPFGTLSGATEAVLDGKNFDIKAALTADIPAKYFVVASYGSPKVGPTNNFGGSQWALNSPAGWKQRVTGDGTRIPSTDADGFVYFVFDLSKWGADYTSTVAGAADASYVQFVLNYIGDGELGLYKGYIVPGTTTITTPVEGNGVVVMPFESTTHPDGLNWGAGDAVGYLTNKLPGGLSWN